MSTTPPVTDQFQYVKLPDGSYGKFAANAGDDVIRGAIQKDFPDAFKPPADTRSLYQKAKDNFNANTQGAKPGDGAVKSFIEDVGAGGGDIVRAVAHPLRTAASMATTPDPGLQYAFGDRQKLLEDAKNAPNLARTLGQVGTGAIVAGAAPIVGKAVGNAAIDAVDGTVSAAKRLYPTSQSLTPDVSAARNLSKALVIDPAGVNNFVKSAADEAGTVMGYAKEKGLPINSKVDFANAAKQTADAVQAHFDQQILGSNSTDVVSVPADYRGAKLNVEGSRATLGEVNNRINAIRQEMSPNYRKALQGQTNAANISDADLLAEKRKLTGLLSSKLSGKTGLLPEDIDAIQTQAGKLRTIADESQLSANRDTTAAGRQGMGATTTSSIGTKAGIIDRTLQAVQGGPEVIGNRQILSALKKVTPKPLNLPQPPTQ